MTDDGNSIVVDDESIMVNMTHTVGVMDAQTDIDGIQHIQADSDNGTSGDIDVPVPMDSKSQMKDYSKLDGISVQARGFKYHNQRNDVPMTIRQRFALEHRRRGHINVLPLFQQNKKFFGVENYSNAEQNDPTRLGMAARLNPVQILS